MLRLELPRGKDALRVLCLGAHADDIEIGCGGTLLRLAAERPLAVEWMIFSATPVRAREARRSAGLFLKGASASRLVLRRFRDGFFPAQFGAIKQEFERRKRRGAPPDLVLSPWREDAHQDHRTVAELAWNTFRDHLILEYEIPKYDGDLGRPGLFVPLAEETCRKKIDALRRAFRSQKARRWFRDDTFWSLLRLRGIESNSPTGFAEAFHCRKAVL